MGLLILLSLVFALFVLILITKLNNHPSKKDRNAYCNLNVDNGSIEYEYQKQIRREKIEKVIRYTIAYTLLSVAAFFVIFPFYWMFATSVKSAEEVLKMPPTIFPQKIHLNNFSVAMRSANFGRFMINTIIVGVFSTIGTLITTITAAFAFARLSFKGRDMMFAIFIATMMIPGEMMVITNYITVCNRYVIGGKIFTFETSFGGMAHLQMLAS